MAGLQVSGLGSGLQVDTIVSGLMAIESKPLNNIALKTSKLQTQISDIGKIKAAFEKFNNALKALQAPAAQTALMGSKATSSDPAVIAGSISGQPAVGNYAVNVTALAAGQKLVSLSNSADPAVAMTTTDGSITIEKGAITGGTLDNATGLYSGASFSSASTSTIAIPAGSTLNQIRDAINASSSGARASVIFDGTDYKLTLSSSGTGAQESLKVSAAGDANLTAFFGYDVQGTQNFKQTQAASNLAATVDGIPISSKTNTLSQAIDGLSMVANKIGSSTLSVSQDSSAVSNSLTTIVSSWNELTGLYSSLASYNSTTKVAGSLYGDSFISSMMNQLRQSVFGSQSPGAKEGFQTLASVGITLNTAGLASLDASKLSSALGKDPEAVAKLFSTSAGNAGAEATVQLTAALGANGFRARVEGLNRRVTSYNEQKARLQARLDATEISLRKRFTNLDTLVSGLNQTGSFLTQKFNSSNS